MHASSYLENVDEPVNGDRAVITNTHQEGAALQEERRNKFCSHTRRRRGIIRQ